MCIRDRSARERELTAELLQRICKNRAVIVIEHDLDVIAEADWILDLGPEGGNAGGRIVAAATPEAVVAAGTHTGKALATVLAR